MIAVDTNVLRHYLWGTIDSYTAIVAEAINTDEASLPPIVLTEALSDPQITEHDVYRTLAVPLVPLYLGYWDRAGDLRRRLIQAARSAPIADCLIAQACIDVDVPLLTYDRGFTRFVDAGLKLIEV
jgi:predicted nucleic acid-binding protein